MFLNKKNKVHCTLTDFEKYTHRQTHKVNDMIYIQWSIHTDKHVGYTMAESGQWNDGSLSTLIAVCQFFLYLFFHFILSFREIQYLQ